MPTKKEEPSLLDVVDAAIGAIKKRLKEDNDDKVKGTVGDLIRLLQLRQELAAEKPGKKVTAGWVDECETTRIDL
jgi:hypothetical protein